MIAVIVTPAMLEKVEFVFLKIAVEIPRQSKMNGEGFALTGREGLVDKIIRKVFKRIVIKLNFIAQNAFGFEDVSVLWNIKTDAGVVDVVAEYLFKTGVPSGEALRGQKGF